MSRGPDSTSYKAFVSACKKAGPRNLVAEALQPMHLLAASGDAPPGLAAALEGLTVRPFYTPHELAAVWPILAMAYQSKRLGRPDPAILRRSLLARELPMLRKPSGLTLYEHNGHLKEWFVVQDVRRWKGAVLTQEQFTEIMERTEK